MHINVFLIPFVIILGLLLSEKDNNNHRMLYIVICSTVLIFVAAMRNPEWMTYTYAIDTLKYEEAFESSFYIQWSDLWSRFQARYFYHTEEYDIGFIVLNKIIGLFTHSFQVYSLLADLLFFVPLGILLYRYSTSILQIIFAYVFYIALIQVFLFGGARQIFAIGFDLMALLAMLDKK